MYFSQKNCQVFFSQSNLKSFNLTYKIVKAKFCPAVDLDKLGLTDNENPYGALPPIFDRSMRGRQAGAMMADFVAAFIKRRLYKREAIEVPKNAFHGGERALLYGTTEDMLSTLGLDGRACLLRAICEVHGHSMSNFGLIGEMLKLFFS